MQINLGFKNVVTHKMTFGASKQKSTTLIFVNWLH